MVLQLHLHGEQFRRHIGHDTHILDAQPFPLGLQLNTSHDAVPVALCLVGHRVGVLSHTDVLNTIIDTDGYLVALPSTDVFRHIILMGH